MFDNYQKIRLRDLAWRRNEKRPDYTKANIRLEAYIEELQMRFPGLFHDNQSLPKRVFMDRPLLTIPYSHALRDYHNSTIKMIENTK